MEELQVIETTSGRQFKPWVDADKLQEAVSNPASVTAIASEIASGKQAIAQAINAKGGNASVTESFNELADDIINLNNSFITYGVEVTEKIHWFKFICDSSTVARLPLTTIDDDVVTTITQPSSFQSCTALESVRMTALVTLSGEHAFQGCTVLQKVIMPNLVTISGSGAFAGCPALQEVTMPNLTTISSGQCFNTLPALQYISLPSLIAINGNFSFAYNTSLQEVNMPNLTVISGGNTFINCSALSNVIFGTLTTLLDPFINDKPSLRNITIGEDTNINLPFYRWSASNVIAEGQSGIDELNSNLYNNLLTKLYDHSQDGQTRTLRIGWLAKVTAENIAYANAKGWTLTT